MAIYQAGQNDSMSHLETETEVASNQQTRLKNAWDAVPKLGGKKGCAFDADKNIVGILAITDDGTLILNQQDAVEFVVVSQAKASGWRISPFNDLSKVGFVWVKSLLC